MQVKNINTGGSKDRVREDRYLPVRDAILAVLPDRDPGMTFDELVKAIRPRLSRRLFPQVKTVRWYAKTVQLDLEARELIERIPMTRPLRLRRLDTPI